MRFLVLLAIFISLAGCTIDKVQIIDSDFWTYVDLFFEEGQKRGFEKELNDFDIRIGYGEVIEGAQGQCHFRDNEVTIDKKTWNRLDEQERTLLIFHELGHCILERHHRNETLELGECLSLMRGGEDDFSCTVNIYSEKWWDYYVDELFDQEIVTPEWMTTYPLLDSVVETDLIMKSNNNTSLLYKDGFNLIDYPKFLLNLTFSTSDKDILSVVLIFGDAIFSVCDRCIGTNVSIKLDNNPMYRALDPDIAANQGSDIKLTILGTEEDLFFYVNETFVHSFERSLLGNAQLLRTNTFDELLWMSLRFYEIE